MSQKGLLNTDLRTRLYLLLQLTRGFTPLSPETVLVDWSIIWVQYWAEAQIQQSLFGDVHTHTTPHSDQGSLRAPPDAAGGSSQQELIQSSHEEPGHELPLKCRERGHAGLPLAYQTSQAAALVRAEVLYLYHTRGSSHAARLLKAEAAFYYSGQSSVSSQWGIGLQYSMLASVRRYPYRRASQFCLCRDRFVAKFSWGELHSMLWKPWATGILVGVNYICQI